MAQGIDAKGGIQNGKGASDAGQEKAADGAHPPMHEQSDEEGKQESRKDNRHIIPRLPHDDGVSPEAGGVSLIRIAVSGKQPSAVAVPKPTPGVIGVFRAVTLSVMAKMICRPLEHRVLKRPSTSDQQEDLDRCRTVKAAMRGKPMVANRDSETRHDIEKEEQGPIKRGVAVQIAETWYDNHRADGDDSEQETSPNVVERSTDGNWSLGEGDHAVSSVCAKSGGPSAMQRPRRPFQRS